GVVAVAGEFAAGDPVEVVCDSELVGKGVAEHSAAVIDRLRGKRSEEVAELIGEGAPEAVHRDRFVLL
ncbi:MAG TPA: PUA domain-containing protein, partial [Solirubrobacterales bacterium]|nr:PUA domain-containing protein [Solirubrobacterales bacterium]